MPQAGHRHLTHPVVGRGGSVVVLRARLLAALPRGTRPGLLADLLIAGGRREPGADLFFSALKSYTGAFHMSPDYAWWYGYADVLGHLATIRDEAERLRSAEAVRKRTLFMIFTGPVMVLAVVGGAYGAWRGWRRVRPPRSA